MDALNKMASHVNNHKVAWSDLVEKYPDKWILFNEYEPVNDDRLFLCNLLEVCDDDSRDDRKLFYLDNGIRAIARRTNRGFIIDEE